MADIRYALRDGDATTTGGVLIAKGFFFTHHGKTVALEGDTATCPACKAQGRVYNDCIPNFDVMGMRLLVSGARVYCKCAEPPRVIHSQQDFSIEVVDRAVAAPFTATAGATASAPSPDFPASAAPMFNERFVLRDSRSKAPLTRVAYALQRADGSLEFGTTDAEGKTHMLSATVESEHITIYVEGEA